MIYVSIAFAFLSGVFLSLAIYFHRKSKKILDYEKRDMAILNDLMSNRGRALFKVSRLAPNEHFAWSPKDIH